MELDFNLGDATKGFYRVGQEPDIGLVAILARASEFEKLASARQSACLQTWGLHGGGLVLAFFERCSPCAEVLQTSLCYVPAACGLGAWVGWLCGLKPDRAH